MKITSKNGKGDRIHISVDGEYLLTVDACYWYTCGHTEGEELNEKELAAFIEAAGFRRTYNAAINILSYRDHSARELENKLVLKGHSRECAADAVEKIKAEGFVNDERYAETLAADLFERKGMCPQKIKYELISRGVSSQIAENAVLGIDKDNISRIIELLSSKFSNRISDEKGIKKVYNSLQRLGYLRSDIAAALRSVDIETGTED